MAKFRKQYAALDTLTAKTKRAGMSNRERAKLVEQDRTVHKNMASAFSGVIFEVAGVKLRDTSSIGKYPPVIHVRHSSPAEYEGVVVGDELRSIDPMRHDITDSTVNGFDVLGLTFEGICRLLSGRQSLTGDRIENVELLQRSQIQMRFFNPPTGRYFQVPVNPEDVEAKLAKMRRASDHLGISEVKIERNLWSLFAEMDADGNGHIDVDELRSGLERIHCYLDGSDIQEMFREVDDDGNGTIEWSEFKDAMICICGDTYMNQYPSWGVARDQVRQWMMATDPRSSLDGYWPLVVVLSLIHVMAISAQAILSFGLNFGDDKEPPPNLFEDSRTYRTVALIVASVCSLMSALAAVRLGGVEWLCIAGTCQVIGSALAAMHGVTSARRAVSEEQATWQRSCSVIIVLTGSMTASFSLCLGIRLSIYIWLQSLVHKCLKTHINVDLGERLSQMGSRLGTTSNSLYNTANSSMYDSRGR